MWILLIVYLVATAMAWYTVRLMIISEGENITDDISYIYLVFIPVVNVLTIYVAISEIMKNKSKSKGNVYYIKKFFNVK